MAGKRGATSDLNHDNWDQEEESEDAGAWKEAGKDVLKERVIRKAKRRGVTKTVSGGWEHWITGRPCTGGNYCINQQLWILVDLFMLLRNTWQCRDVQRWPKN